MDITQIKSSERSQNMTMSDFPKYICFILKKSPVCFNGYKMNSCYFWYTTWYFGLISWYVWSTHDEEIFFFAKTNKKLTIGKPPHGSGKCILEKLH